MPRLALDQAADILDRLESRPVVMATELCARQRHRLSTCTRCVDACPSGAISWQDGLQVDAEVCSGCGICAAVCPTGALETRSPANAELMVRVRRIATEQGSVAFACPQTQTAFGGGQPWLSVDCIGQIDESLIVGAVACGAKSVWLVDTACESCPQGVGRAVASVVLRRSNELLDAFGIAPHIALRGDLPAADGPATGHRGAGQGMSRRGLFKHLVHETARLGEVTADTVRRSGDARADPPVAKGKLPVALPDKRLHLLAALKLLGQPLKPVLTGTEDGLFARFELAEGCTACQMCAFFCPTGALTKVEEGGRVGLAFRSSACTNCGLCRDICYRDAARLTHQVDLTEVLALSVDWLFVQDMGTAPWQDPPDQRIGRGILESLGI
jgi:ferredoxin